MFLDFGHRSICEAESADHRRESHPMASCKKTGKKAASAAGKVLKTSKSKVAKTAAGSALSQREKRKK